MGLSDGAPRGAAPTREVRRSTCERPLPPPAAGFSPLWVSGRYGAALLFVGRYLEARQAGLAEGRGKRAIGGVAPAGHQNAADARRVVARVEREPTAAQVDLEPGAEVHGRRRVRHADVTQVARGVARGNVHAAT